MGICKMSFSRREFEIPAAELPAGKELTIAVRPCSSLGTKGKTIGTTWRV